MYWLLKIVNPSQLEINAIQWLFSGPQTGELTCFLFLINVIWQNGWTISEMSEEKNVATLKNYYESVGCYYCIVDRCYSDYPDFCSSWNVLARVGSVHTNIWPKRCRYLPDRLPTFTCGLFSHSTNLAIPCKVYAKMFSLFLFWMNDWKYLFSQLDFVWHEGLLIKG